MTMKKVSVTAFVRGFHAKKDISIAQEFTVDVPDDLSDIEADDHIDKTIHRLMSWEYTSEMTPPLIIDKLV